MDKTLGLFSMIYKPVYKQIDKTLDSVNKPERYFTMMNDIMKLTKKGGDFDKSTLPIPYIVAQKITVNLIFKTRSSTSGS